MTNYILSCEMPADLTRDHFEKRNILYIPFHFFLDEQEYKEDFGETVPFEEFYARIAKGAATRTSQPNISEYKAAFTPYLEKGMDVVHLCLSSGISGAYNSAKNAAEILAEIYPDNKVYIIDSRAASSGMGLLADTAADKRDEGMTAEESLVFLVMLLCLMVKYTCYCFFWPHCAASGTSPIRDQIHALCSGSMES